jgi:flagellar basal-body rod protein FlgG
MDLRNAGPFSVSANGEISHGTDQKGRLNLVEFNDPKHLTQAGGGYFLANNPDLTVTPSEQATVRQGYLEGANTTSISEMVNLMSAMRNFEANQRMIQIQDDQMGRVIQDLGQPT